jgi:hypothetical protein
MQGLDMFGGLLWKQPQMGLSSPAEDARWCAVDDDCFRAIPLLWQENDHTHERRTWGWSMNACPGFWLPREAETRRHAASTESIKNSVGFGRPPDAKMRQELWPVWGHMASHAAICTDNYDEWSGEAVCNKLAKIVLWIHCFLFAFFRKGRWPFWQSNSEASVLTKMRETSIDKHQAGLAGRPLAQPNASSGVECRTCFRAKTASRAKIPRGGDLTTEVFVDTTDSEEMVTSLLTSERQKQHAATRPELINCFRHSWETLFCSGEALIKKHTTSSFAFSRRPAPDTEWVLLILCKTVQH